MCCWCYAPASRYEPALASCARKSPRVSLQNGWSQSLQALTADMISCANRSTSSLASADICSQLIEDLVRMASDDESHAAAAQLALQACGALPCSCRSEQVRAIVQLAVDRQSVSSSMDSDLSVCLLHASAFAIRRFVTFDTWST